MKIFRQFSFLNLFLFITFSAAAQKLKTNITLLGNIPDPGNNIVYDPHRKLAIEDFKGQADPNSSAVAITTSGFMFKAGYRNASGNESLEISVYCSFDKRLSWMKERGKTEYILLHEQHHFDISYIGTLLFIKKIKQVKFNGDDYTHRLKQIYNQAVNSMEQLQNKYDSETNNGTLSGKQAEWNKKIEQQLALLTSETN